MIFFYFIPRPTLLVRLAWYTAGLGWSILPLLGEKVHNPLADGGSSYEAWETLDYWKKMESETDFTDKIGADYYVDWRFRTDSDDIICH